jgi:hypothetical protein
MNFNTDPFNRSPFNRPYEEIPNVLYIPKPHTPVIENYPVGVYDENFNWIAEIDDYISLSWTRRWRTAGEFELQVSRYDKSGNDRDLDADYWISLYRGGIARIAQIKTMELPLDANGKASEIWTIRGPDAKGILASRIAMVGVTSGTGFDTQTAVSAEAAMRHYIDGNIISATDVNRRIAALEFETIHAPQLGGTVSYSARLEDLPAILEAICLASPDQVGYDVVFIRSTKKLQYRTLLGTDRSATVKFSTLIGNAAAMAYTHDRTPVKTVAYVGDAGVDAARTFSEVYDGTEPAGLDRIETFVDGSDTTTAAELTQRGHETLNECGAAETAEFSVLKDKSVQYSTRAAAGDYDNGDIVTVVYGGIMTMAARIVEITEEYGVNGSFDDVRITTGTSKDDLKRFFRQQEKKNSVRRRA